MNSDYIYRFQFCDTFLQRGNVIKLSARQNNKECGEIHSANTRSRAMPA
jgi:hypothetical protein